MFSASPVLTLDRYRLFLPLPPTSVNSVPSALKSTLNSTAPLASAGHSPQATIPFRITSFAHPHHLTPIESHSCKKQGRGRYLAPPPNPFLFFPHRVNMQHAAMPGGGISTLFMRLLNTSRHTRGGGGTTIGRSASGFLDLRYTDHRPRNTDHVFSARLRQLCVSALSFSPLFLSTFNCRLSTLNLSPPLFHYSLPTIRYSRSPPELLPSRPQTTA